MRVLLYIVIFLITSVSSYYSTAEDSPNVLFIIVDDLRPSLGAFGDGEAITPNIDRLAESGTIFNRSYVQIPLCAPSRQSMMTGLRPETIRTYDLDDRFRDVRPDAVTLPQHFLNSGYRTVSLGKVFHNGTNDEASWSDPSWWATYPWHEYFDPVSLEILGETKKRLETAGGTFDPDLFPEPSRTWGSKQEAWQAPEVPDDLPADGRIADKAIEMLHQLKDQPFFLAVGFLKPHLPFVAPEKYFDLYPPGSVSLDHIMVYPSDAPKIASTFSRELRGFTDIADEAPIRIQKARELIRAYYASVSYIDAQVGRVLDELDRLGLSEDTIIVLWGDHGFSLGEAGLWGKRSLFEQSVHAPLLISTPEHPNPGTSTDALVEAVDIFPTLCELTGLPIPESMEGKSLVPLMRNPERTWKEAVFSQIPRGIHPFGSHEEITAMGRSVRTDRYRYTEWEKPDGSTEAVELYDYVDGVIEKQNQAGNPGYREVERSLRTLLQNGGKSARPASNKQDPK